MKLFVVSMTFAALVATQAVAQTAVATGARPSPYSAYASEPSGHHGVGHGVAPQEMREQAVHTCSMAARPYSETTWGNFAGYTYRSCMMEHHQPE